MSGAVRRASRAVRGGSAVPAAVGRLTVAGLAARRALFPAACRVPYRSWASLAAATPSLAMVDAALERIDPHPGTPAGAGAVRPDGRGAAGTGRGAGPLPGAPPDPASGRAAPAEPSPGRRYGGPAPAGEPVALFAAAVGPLDRSEAGYHRPDPGGSRPPRPAARERGAGAPRARVIGPNGGPPARAVPGSGGPTVVRGAGGATAEVGPPGVVAGVGARVAVDTAAGAGSGTGARPGRADRDLRGEGGRAVVGPGPGPGGGGLHRGERRAVAGPGPGAQGRAGGEVGDALGGPAAGGSAESGLAELVARWRHAPAGGPAPVPASAAGTPAVPPGGGSPGAGAGGWPEWAGGPGRVAPDPAVLVDDLADVLDELLRREAERHGLRGLP